MPEPISACTVPMSYSEEAPEESAPAPKTARQASCEAAYAECMDAAENEAVGFSLACGGSALVAALGSGPFAPVAGVGFFVLCEGKNVFDLAADEAMCRSSHYRCDPGQ
jgi:hypothetical protein